ncbi:hypothetical protein PCE1_000328 [Barthelona sp. PCE]
MGDKSKRIQEHAANIVKGFLAKQSMSLKSSVFSLPLPAKQKAALYGIVVSALSHFSRLNEFFLEVVDELSQKEFNFSLEFDAEHVIALYELLEGPYKADSKKTLKRKRFPTFVRRFIVHIDFFRSKYEELSNRLPEACPLTAASDMPLFVRSITAKLNGKPDDLLKNVYSFENTRKNAINFSRMAKEGTVVIQDRASCFPPHVMMSALKNENLDDYEDVCTLDMCAAPGNKTTYLAHMLNELDPHITQKAVELNRRRYNLLRRNLDRHPFSKGVITYNKSCLDLTDSEKQNVTHIMLDPSCSSSGVVRSVDAVLMSHVFGEPDLGKYTTFQKECLEESLSNMPMGRFLVYSTCSVNNEENEQMILDVLPLAREHGWELVKVCPELSTRGNDIASTNDSQLVAECSLRFEPGDTGNGFYIAAFKRTIR